MPSRRRINKKFREGKIELRQRLSDTPKKSTPSKRTTNGVLKFSDITNTPQSAIRRKSTISIKPDVSHNNADDMINIKEILKVNWKVFRVSPLYDFHKNKLNLYAKKLKEELVAANYKVENAVYDCKFQFKRLLLQETHDVIQMTVTASNNKYIGYFISSTETQVKEEISNIKYYPVLLVQAGGKILKQVHNVFCKFFDCDVHPANFSFQALVTFFTLMSLMYVNDVPNLDSEEVTLYYKIPGSPQADNISISLSLGATSTVFAAFNLEFGRTKLNSTQIILGFYDLIIKHVLNVYRIDLSLAELYKIIFPDFAVNSEGWVKFRSEDVVKKIIPGMEDFVKLEYIVTQ